MIICFRVFDNGAIKGGGSENMISSELLSFGDWCVSHDSLHLKSMGEVWLMTVVNRLPNFATSQLDPLCDY